ERRQEGRERRDQGRALRAGVLETREREQVEAREAERPEPPEPQPAAVEAEGAAPLDDGEDREQDEPRERVADGREVEGVDPVDGRLADDELPAPREPRGRAERCSDQGFPHQTPSSYFDRRRRKGTVRPPRLFRCSSNEPADLPADARC